MKTREEKLLIAFYSYKCISRRGELPEIDYVTYKKQPGRADFRDARTGRFVSLDAAVKRLLGQEKKDYKSRRQQHAS